MIEYKKLGYSITEHKETHSHGQKKVIEFPEL